ncbi:DHS-like NAD/FAD-binding domain-containing protein [Sphaerosporella brunnea]|uniref:DHS-like NAD/FAD-binding domain-containing protein n=1 Tax=Sphaerosporella brunnea TaxID=1250544 RepID=A0A5J5EZX2_9PEZI|nr:DHS-like NAD/FAD-binding domain-containing protein [Sphaerosporella brunnea]
MVLPRIPYTSPFPAPTIHPSHAVTLPAAIRELTAFLTSAGTGKTLLLSGAGISVASGLSDYRGEAGTYRLNRSYRPIFFHEFTSRHAARQRYWARSFLGFPLTAEARPNAAHAAAKKLWEMGVLGAVVTQNVDSLHGFGDGMEVVELHGTLRDVVCLSCHHKVSREEFQRMLAALNPLWRQLLLDDAAVMRKVKTNPDGDVDMPGVEYSRFRYPPCPLCLRRHPELRVDRDGAFLEQKTGDVTGVLKPCVTFFGENVASAVKARAEALVEEAAAVLVVGSSLATYSAWRLVRGAARREKGLGIVNLGGVRGEAEFFGPDAQGARIRLEVPAAEVLKGVVGELRGRIAAPVEHEMQAELRNGLSTGLAG